MDEIPPLLRGFFFVRVCVATPGSCNISRASTASSQKVILTYKEKLVLAPSPYSRGGIYFLNKDSGSFPSRFALVQAAFCFVLKRVFIYFMN